MTHPSIDKHVKRIQSQLSRLGVRVTKDQVREVYKEVVGDFSNPTDEERAIVVEKLSSSEPQDQETSSELATVGPELNAQPPTLNIENSKSDLDSQPTSTPAEEEDNRGTGRLTTITDTSKAITQPSPTTGGISPAEVTQAINQAIAQVGADSSAETIQILTSLANELSADITDTQEMISALIKGYLSKRQNVLASAIGTVQTLRTAQTSSFQGGLDNDFFDRKHRGKQQFLNNLQEMFN